MIGTRPMDVMDLIQAHSARSNNVRITLRRSGDRVQILGSAPGAFGRDAMVQLVRFNPEQTVDIRRGENAGRTLSYANIVTTWGVVGTWDGRADLGLSVQAVGSDPVVVIVQEPGPGAVLATAILR